MNIKHYLLTVLVALVSNLSANAYGFEVDGIYYNTLSLQDLTCEVTNKDDNTNYSGNIVIPSHVTYENITYLVVSVSNFSFQNSPDLHSVYFSEGITTIKNNAFSGCTNLATIHFPNSLTSIGAGGISETAWFENQPNGMIYINDNILLCYKGNPEDLSICNVKAGTEYIAAYAFFHNEHITAVNLPEGVKEIGASAFRYCPNLKSINLPESLERIEDYSFSQTGLEKVEIPNGITTIENSAFSYCTSLKNVTLPYNLTTIKRSVFYGCESLTNINIPDNVVNIEQYAFSGTPVYDNNSENDCVYIGKVLYEYKKSSGTTFTIRAGTKGISNNVFANSQLQSISIPSTVEYIGDYAFQSCTSLASVVLPENLKHIGNYAFDNCQKLIITKIPANVDVIGDYAFQYCSSISYLDIKGATKIGKFAFSQCTKLSNVAFPEGLKQIGASAFNGCQSLTAVALPQSLTYLSAASFAMTGITEVTIPKNVENIEGNPFVCCQQLSAINVESGNRHYVVSDGIIYSKDMKELVIYPTYLSGTEFSIPNGTTTLKPYSLAFSRSLRTVAIPNSIKNIGEGAFINSGITSIVVPYGIKTIPTGTFDHCQNLSDVKLPNGLERIYSMAFQNCSSLASINIPFGVKKIYNSAFYGCSKLATIYNSSDLVLTLGSTDNGYVAYYANEIIAAKTEVYNGVRNPILTGNEENFNQIATAANALIFFYGEHEHLSTNQIAQNKANNISLTDAEPFYCPSDVTAENLSYTRTFGSTDWQALYIPFNMSYDEWAGKAEVAEIMGVHTYDRNDDGVIDESFIEFKKLKEGAELLPNTPYVIKPASTGEVVFTCSNKTLAATPAEDGKVWCASTRQKYTLTGLYQETPITGNYALVNGTFMKITSSYPQYPNRFYLTIEDVNNGYGSASASQAPQRVRIMVDGEVVTGIDSINGVANEDACYDLSGRRIAKPAHGIYIKNGKKLFIN